MRYHTYSTGLQVSKGGPPYSSTNTYIRGVPDAAVKEALPDWKEKVAQGIDATTNYQRDIYREFPVVGTHWWYSSQYQYYEQVWTTDANHNHSYPNINSDLVRLATNIAEKRWASKLAELRPQVMSGVIAGEFKETIDMIAHPYKGIVDLATKYLVGAKSLRTGLLSKRNKRKLGKFNSSRHKEEVSVLHTINQSYLETVYGVMPLMGDIQNVLDELNTSRLRHTEDVVAKGFADGIFTLSGNNWDPIRNNRVYCNFERDYHEVCSVKKFAKILLEQDLSTNSRYGFDLRSFVPTLWELLPMSFMFDYVTNIGDILSALSYQTPNQVYSYTNVRTVQAGRTYFSGLTFHESLAPWERAEFGAIFPDYRFERVSFSRSKGTPMSPSSFVLETPSLRQALNASSVLLSVFQSRL